MDAKSKANFINSVVGGQETICINCGTKNKSDSKFCITCGRDLVVTPKEDNAPAFAPVKEAATGEAEKVEVKSAKMEKYEEPISVFAQGLPAWNLEPPQVMVRRR